MFERRPTALYSVVSRRTKNKEQASHAEYPRRAIAAVFTPAAKRLIRSARAGTRTVVGEGAATGVGARNDRTEPSCGSQTRLAGAAIERSAGTGQCISS